MDQHMERSKLPIFLTLEEIKVISTRLAILETKIDQALSYHSEVNVLQEKVHNLELGQAGQKSRREQWRWTIGLAWALFLTLIAAGVWLR